MDTRLTAAAHRRTRRRWQLLGISVVVAAALLLPNGWRLRQLTARTRAVDADVARLETSIQRLIDERDKLQSDPTYVERVARQEFRASRAGEMIWKIPPTTGEAHPAANPNAPPLPDEPPASE